MKTRVGSLFTLLLLLLISCKEEPDELLGKVVLDKVIFHENIDQVGQYHYNKSGLVQRYEYYFDQKLVEYVEYFYSGSKITSKQYFQIVTNGSFKLTGTDVYTYNPNGDLFQIIKNRNGIKEGTYTFSWQANKINRIRIDSYNLGTTYTSYQDFEYDQNGNAKTVKYYNLQNNNAELSFLVELEYDNKPNPYFAIAEPYDYLLNNFNNIIKSEQRSKPGEAAYATSMTTYQYNEAGLPQELVTKTNLFGQESEKKIKFSYKQI